MMLSGPILGTLPILAAYYLLPDQLFNLICFGLMYLAGCRRDLSEFACLVFGKPVDGIEMSE